MTKTELAELRRSIRLGMRDRMSRLLQPVDGQPAEQVAAANDAVARRKAEMGR